MKTPRHITTPSGAATALDVQSWIEGEIKGAKFTLAFKSINAALDLLDPAAELQMVDRILQHRDLIAPVKSQSKLQPAKLPKKLRPNEKPPGYWAKAIEKVLGEHPQCIYLKTLPTSLNDLFIIALHRKTGLYPNGSGFLEKERKRISARLLKKAPNAKTIDWTKLVTNVLGDNPNLVSVKMLPDALDDDFKCFVYHKTGAHPNGAGFIEALRRRISARILKEHPPKQEPVSILPAVNGNIEVPGDTGPEDGAAPCPAA